MCYAYEYYKVLRKPVGAAAAAPPLDGRPSRIRLRFQVGQADLHPTPKTRVPRAPVSVFELFSTWPLWPCLLSMSLVPADSVFSPCWSSNLGKICESATDTLALVVFLREKQS